MVEEIYEFHYAILLVSNFQQSKFVEHLVNPVDEFRFVGVRSESKVTKLVFIKKLERPELFFVSRLVPVGYIS